MVANDGKAFYKLISNAVYGKTMENLRNRVDVRLANNRKIYLKWTAKLSYVKQKVFDKHLVAIHKIEIILTLNKPVYARMYVLELRKMLLHEFHFDYIKNKSKIEIFVHRYWQRDEWN